MRSKDKPSTSKHSLLYTTHTISFPCCIHVQEPICLRPVIFRVVSSELWLTTHFDYSVPRPPLSPPLSHCLIFARSSLPNLMSWSPHTLNCWVMHTAFEISTNKSCLHAGF